METSAISQMPVGADEGCARVGGFRARSDSKRYDPHFDRRGRGVLMLERRRQRTVIVDRRKGACGAVARDKGAGLTIPRLGRRSALRLRNLRGLTELSRRRDTARIVSRCEWDYVGFYRAPECIFRSCCCSSGALRFPQRNYVVRSCARRPVEISGGGGDN